LITATLHAIESKIGVVMMRRLAGLAALIAGWAGSVPGRGTPGVAEGASFVVSLAGRAPG